MNKYLDKHGLETFWNCIQKTAPVQSKRAEDWDADPTFIGACGTIYVYMDARIDPQGRSLAGLKVGDGTTYLIDLPFLDEELYSHIENGDVHITPQERLKWNNKVRCYMSDSVEEELIFTTN